ncbi:MAG: CHRD domain-containing protein [Gemmatimonadaceae bacterium]|nr:CHRD domain-containing protein [Gemmatimonadaceae bacterium]
MKYSMITILAAGFAVSACGGGSSAGGLDAEQNYLFALTPGAEVPAPKPTTASGTVSIVVFPTSIDYQISASSITGITMAHIHNGAPGVAGSVVVTLFSPATPTVAINGVFVSGTITQGTLPAGVTLESVKTLLLSGNAT